ncbi:MAG: potassium-transporting ATPase subunit KdpB [Acidimicrobiales bacterium]
MTTATTEGRLGSPVAKNRSRPSGSGSLFDPDIVRRALRESVTKLDPRLMVRNPVMFVVELGSVLTTILFVRDFGSSSSSENVFAGLITAWLWFTVLFANFAEAVAEGRGKAQADTLRAARTDTAARVMTSDGSITERSSSLLEVGDRVVCESGDIIPSDGTVVEGIASVDESAITGESAPVIRESGGDRSAVTGGTKVLSDRIVVEITARPGETFLDRMISLVEGAARQKTPNEIALNILLAGLTIIFMLAVVTLQPFAVYSGAEQSLLVLIALLVCLIPTTIGALLSAIGIAGMDRMVQRNVLAMSGRAVEAAGDVSTLLLDKTGTITLGNRQAAEFVALPGVSIDELAEAAMVASLADETPEGRSVVELAQSTYGRTARTLEGAILVPFTAQTRMSGVDLDGRQLRKGATDSVRRWVSEAGGPVPEEMTTITDAIASAGGTPLVVAEASADGRYSVLGVIHLKDVVKAGMAERFDQLRAMGIRTVMITGDNPLTAKAIAAEAGVDDFLAEATPEDKMALIRQEQEGGRLVAMTGDGTNDAPALAQADVGLAMNTGTQAAKEAGNMIDLDSNPTKLIEVVEVGKQLLITRGNADAVSPNLRPTFLDEVVPAAVASLGPRGRTVNIEVTETTPAVDADPGLLERVLANLIDNAVAHSPADSPVRVEVGETAGRVMVRVVDRGPGVTNRDRERVFQPFQRMGDSSPRAGAGVGLGLAVARGFSRAMGGDVTIEDTPGGGATFVVDLEVAG